jgi:HAD superfamily hydrolase (TIGR01509 family)
MTTSVLAPGSADALLFDLGRVVLDVDFDRALAHWAQCGGCTPADLVERFERGDVYKQHERGEIDDATFFADVRRALQIDISDQDILAGWNAIIVGEMAGIAPLLARAARRLPLYVLSNTNRAHETHFSQAHAEVLGHFREIYLSSTIGFRKPEAGVYDHVIKAIGVPPERIVFFDDLLENIEAARQRGMIGVLVRSTRDVADTLVALGL